MPSLNSLYGDKYIRDPRLLNLLVQTPAAIKIKNGTTDIASTDLGFFTALARQGATANVSADDTYVTVCDITGAGFFNNAIAPMYDSGNYRATFKFTIDGIVYTIATGASTVPFGTRAVWGCAIPYSATTTLSNPPHIGVATYNDGGVEAAKSGSVIILGTSREILLPNTHFGKLYGLAGVRFDKSLKVEIKISTITNSAVKYTAGAMYALDL